MTSPEYTLEFRRELASREVNIDGTESANLEDFTEEFGSGSVNTNRDSYNNLLLVSGSNLNVERLISIPLLKVTHDISALRKSVMTAITELVPRRQIDAPDVVPRELLTAAESDILDLEKQIKDLLSSLTSLNSQLASLNASSSSADANSAALQTQSDALQDQITNLLKQIADLSERLAILRTENIALKALLGSGAGGDGADDTTTVPPPAGGGFLSGITLVPGAWVSETSIYREDAGGNFINTSIPEKSVNFTLNNDSGLPVVASLRDLPTRGVARIYKRTEMSNGGRIPTNGSGNFTVSYDPDVIATLDAGRTRQSIRINIVGDTPSTKEDTFVIEILIDVTRQKATARRKPTGGGTDGGKPGGPAQDDVGGDDEGDGRDARKRRQE